ncbi:General Transcription Factor 3C Polypeptide 5 [Manis pentadactyla]|nr:General Transcription Factor 3C Polypeptide 5 [Manis pentadactyla]
MGVSHCGNTTTHVQSTEILSSILELGPCDDAVSSLRLRPFLSSQHCVLGPWTRVWVTVGFSKRILKALQSLF